MYIGLVEVVAISWFYGIDRFFDHINEMIGSYPKPYIFWKVVLKFVTPVYLTVRISTVFDTNLTTNPPADYLDTHFVQHPRADI